jgi:hypothetical protein
LIEDLDNAELLGAIEDTEVATHLPNVTDLYVIKFRQIAEYLLVEFHYSTVCSSSPAKASGALL